MTLCIKSLKKKHRIAQTCRRAAILCLGMLLCFPAFVWPQDLPAITEAINEHLLSDDTQEATQAMVRERQLADALLRELKTELKNSKKQPQTELMETLSTLNGLHFLYARLADELGRKTVPVPGELLQQAPKDLQDLKKYLVQLFKIKREFQTRLSRQKELQKKLDLLWEDLKESFKEYLQLQKTKQRNALWHTAAQLLSLRAEYATNFRVHRRNRQEIEQLNQIIASAQNTLKQAFLSLKSSRTELDILEAQRTAQDKKRQNKMAELTRQLQRLNKAILVYEVKIDTNSQKLEENPKQNPLLKAEQKRLMTRLNELMVQKQGLEQEKIRIKVTAQEDTFWLELGQALLPPSSSKKIAAYLTNWKTTLNTLNDLEASLDSTLDRVRNMYSQLIQKMALLNTENNLVKDRALRLAMHNYYQQLKRSEQTITQQLIRGREIKTYLVQLIFVVQTCHDILEEQSSVYQRVELWSKSRMAQALKDIKNIIFYPLFTLGTEEISLGTILKIMTILLIGIIGLRVSRKKIKALLQQKTELNLGTINSITTLGYYSSLILLILISLSTAGLNLNQLSIVLGALGVGLGFGLQTIANNFVSGLILLTDRSIKVGDFVELDNGLSGQVQDVAIRATVIRTFAGEDVIVPNSEFVSGKVYTWTFADDWRRLKIPFGVSYDADPDQVAEIAMAAAREVQSTREDPGHPIRVFFEGFGDNSLDFSLRVWCRMNQLNTRTGLFSDYYFALFRRLKEAGIEIPFPQRDLHIRSVSQETLQSIKAATSGKETDESSTGLSGNDEGQ